MIIPPESNQFNTMTAKFYAASGFRRRSYDDQEGDNDINIIIQPSDLDDIEDEARAKYAKYLTTFGKIRKQSSNYDHHHFGTSLLPKSIVNHGTKEDMGEQVTLTSKRTSALKSPRFTAMTNIFNDMKLAKCLLDQDYDQTVRLFIEKSALNWNFNSFTFDALCCGKSLTELLLHLFDHYNLYNIFNLDIVKVLKCFRLLEFGYHSTNPYHNSVHAADVTQAMHCFMQENKIRKHMTDLEILCSILAAVCHDLDHPGVNQSFLVATNNPLAELYQNSSVLENHHWRFALCIFREAKLFDHFSQDTLDEMREQLKQLILATDIARQNDYLKRFRDLTSSNSFSMNNTNHRALVLQMALKCADLGNSCRPWLISRVWSNLICDEFYRMGRIERRLGVPLTPICQREKTSIAGIQTDFFRFIVLPLLELWHKFLASPLSDLLMSNFDHNYKRWQRANRIVQQLRRRKSIACLEPVPDDGSASLSDDEQRGTSDLCGPSSETSGNKFHLNAETISEQASKQERDEAAARVLIFDPATEAYYANHSFNAIKRASSDYIKSGNGRLELLRDFQLDRIIEKSPLVTRRKAAKLDKQKQTHQQQQQQQQHMPLRAAANAVTLAAAAAVSTSTVISNKENLQKGDPHRQQHSSTKPDKCHTQPTGNDNNTYKPHDLSQIIRTTKTPELQQQHHGSHRANLGASRANEPARGGTLPTATSILESSQTPPRCIIQSSDLSATSIQAPTLASSIGRQQQQQQHLPSSCGNYRKVLSPIEDDGGEVASPELRASSATRDDGRQMAKVGTTGDDGCCYPAPGGCYGADVTAAAEFEHHRSRKQQLTEATADPTSSDPSQSNSRASSVSSSPVMQPVDQCLSPLHIRQQQHQHQHQKQHQQQRTTQNYPFLTKYFEPSGGNRIKPVNLSSVRQSISNAKTVCSNRRRESDPGCLTDNYEIAAAIMLLQYQNNSLFHKRRSSLPVCVPRRRSSK